MFRRIVRLTFVIFIVIGLSLQVNAQPDYRAIITDLSGTVLVSKASQSSFKPAVWGMQLYIGDRIKSEEGSHVSILMSDNTLLKLGGNAAFTIQAGPGGSGAIAAKSIEEDLYGTLASLKQRTSTNGRARALGGLRGGNGNATQLISPRNTKLKNLRPTFHWRAEKEYDAYVVKLYDQSGLIWSREVENSYMDYPEDEASLVPGRSYFWEVNGQSLLDSESFGKIGFSVLSEADIARIESQESIFQSILEGEENSTNYQFAVGAFYAREGLVESAIASFEEISERHPRAALPHEVLGSLYEKIGLEELAMAEMHRAVALSQEN